MILHFITNHFPPSRGGLESQTLRLATAASGSGLQTIIHVRDATEIDYRHVAEASNLTIDPFSQGTVRWLEPLLASNAHPAVIAKERARLEFLLLRGSLLDSIQANPQEKHLLVSFFIVNEGFLSSLVARELHVPHIAVVVGTDVSRDFLNVSGRSKAAHVLAEADGVIALCSEQQRAISRGFGREDVETIHASASEEALARRWRGHVSDYVLLFSDCGYSHKKGTHVLISAFTTLHDEGLRVKLSICGDTHAGQHKYWNDLRDSLEKKYGGYVSFHDHLGMPQVLDMMTEANIYCSATLGEGCSNARVAALCIGIPVVTTRCGEMIDVATDASHVRLANVAHDASFIAELRDAVVSLIEGTLVVDKERVQAWREHFAPSREAADFLKVFRKFEFQ